MSRPSFQKMVQVIENGYISAVFVKELSRLGRNYIEVGRLTEEFFRSMMFAWLPFLVKTPAHEGCGLLSTVSGVATQL